MTRPASVAVIDDDASMKDALAGLLQSVGIDAVSYGSAETFLDDFGDRSIGCVVTDLQMPGLSGIELIEWLRRGGSRVPVIVITAQLRPDIESRVLAAGGMCLLRKPFEADDLLACVNRALAA